MAHMAPHKLPRGKADSYSIVPLSDTKVVDIILSGLSIATCNPSEENDMKLQVQPEVQPVEGIDKDVDRQYTVSTRMSCNCCTVVFSNRTDQKDHFKSDWHRYNLKQELRGEPSITEDQFESMTDELSSISGSDDTTTTSDDEDNLSVKAKAVPSRLKKLHTFDNADTSDTESEDKAAIMAAARKHPKVFLRSGNGQLVSLYRCVLHHKKNSPSTPAQLLALAEQAKAYSRVAVVMLAGGHFSAAIFDGMNAVVHKTFHRYVVRAKRGFVQSVRDNHGSAPKSGGASLRRYNEAALTQEIQELLMAWSPEMKTCHLIFLRTSAYSRHIFFGGKSPVLSKDDHRVRTIPFTTGRPTFNEARKVHQMLMSVECFGDESLVTDFVPISPARHLNPQTGNLSVTVRTEKNQPRVSNRVPDKKTKRESKAESRTSTAVEFIEPAHVSEENVESDDGEIELVETMMHIPTVDLQEFETCVDTPKRNQKKKKKSNKVSEIDVPAQGNVAVDEAQLSEEDQKLKNLLYTCCKSGDVMQLSQILQELVPLNQQQDKSTTENQTRNESLLVSKTDLTLDESDSSCTSTPVPCVQNSTETVHLGGHINTAESGHCASTCSASCCPDIRKDRFQKLVLGKYGEKELSLLHIAAAAGHANVIATLLGAGCDPTLKESSGKTSYLAAPTKEVKYAFRRFRGNHPDRYDYEAAQIPSALTADMEAERKQREAEKKKAQKKAKLERLKDKRAEEAKAAQEQKERDRFLGLSDREKRALAAERRILHQASEKGVMGTTVLNRCYQCGVDISGKVPFEYMEFQFCSPKCLKEHRLKNASSR